MRGDAESDELVITYMKLWSCFNRLIELCRNSDELPPIKRARFNRFLADEKLRCELVVFLDEVSSVQEPALIFDCLTRHNEAVAALIRYANSVKPNPPVRSEITPKGD